MEDLDQELADAYKRAQLKEFAQSDASAEVSLRQWCVEMAIDRKDDTSDIVALSQQIYDWVKK